MEYNDYFKNRKKYLDQLWHELNGFTDNKVYFSKPEIIERHKRLDKLELKIKSKKNIWE